MNDFKETIAKLEKRLSNLESEKLSILNEITSLKCKLAEHKQQNTNEFSSKEKIDIFMDLFRGRTDVFPKRWDNIKTKKSGYSPACANEWVRGVCNKPKIKCGDCSNQSFIPLTANIVHKHLVGENYIYGKKDHTIGIYPMLSDSKCWFLAVDFDKEKWHLDAKAFINTCDYINVPAYLERSRSGNGGHVWIFFNEPIFAADARKLGSYLMTETMKKNPEIGFESYDRFFPNQDTLPSGGSGNLVDDIITEYGQIIVDECHHLSAVSFESVIQSSKAKYVLGLSATVTRKDGWHPIIFMQCGPIRYKVDAKVQAKLRSFDHKVIIRNTNFVFPQAETQKMPISELYTSMVNDNERNDIIYNDVLVAINNGKTPLILTERKEHVTYFYERFNKFCKNVIAMHGGQGVKQRTEIKKKLDSIADDEERLIIATGKYIGESFDDPRLDALFLTTPISWHGTVAKYAGRLHRTHHSKKEVVVYDYVDCNVQTLVRMSQKRIKGYKKLGYIIT